ncbi:glycosyl-4,4'-diaponeurosporenoate acyltransferase [candidate division CSSED10-310 bacterium]|uniref:Glycosyl-4,4'-diaponeurosporenoate acyltransferase n=1 Tax=candidate division CSSED10-310 bacterium TaxID=2855610 RepID=A0ABV6YZW4_UNCC1
MWELPLFWTIILNIGGWVVIHLSIAYGITLVHTSRFNPAGSLFKKRSWEGDTLYRTILKAHRWKKKLPDGASWFKKGFPKKKLKNRDPEYLKRFIRETCRGELSHWLMFFCAPLFFLWNPPWASVVMVLYAVSANFPCIITQRYNRIYFQKLLESGTVQDKVLLHP